MAKLGVGLLVVAVLSAEAAVADVLVLRDGTRVETRGAWSERGAQLTFTDLEGRLVALRLAEVDLAASRQATAAAAAAARPAPAPVAPKAAIRLTDDDVGHVDTSALEATAATSAEEAKTPQVVFYATAWCGYCKKTRELLRKLDADYVEHDVEKNVAAAREHRRLAPGGGVPVLVIGEQVIRGYDPRAITAAVEKLRKASPKAGGPTGASVASEG